MSSAMVVVFRFVSCEVIFTSVVSASEKNMYECISCSYVCSVVVLWSSAWRYTLGIRNSA